MVPPGGYPPGPPGHPPAHPGYGVPALPPPAPAQGGRVEVKVSYTARVAFSVVVGSLFLLAFLYALGMHYLSEMPSEASTPERPLPLAFLAVLALAFVFFAIPLVLAAEKNRIPHHLDPTGVTMRDGVHHPWHEYRGLRIHELVKRGGFRKETGVELLFARGSALLLYRPITNHGEVLWIAEQLKQGRNPFAM